MDFLYVFVIIITTVWTDLRLKNVCIWEASLKEDVFRAMNLPTFVHVKYCIV